jgi:hypothetical protein
MASGECADHGTDVSGLRDTIIAPLGRSTAMAAAYTDPDRHISSPDDEGFPTDKEPITRPAEKTTTDADHFYHNISSS